MAGRPLLVVAVLALLCDGLNGTLSRSHRDAVFLVQGYDPSRIPQICNKVETVRRVVRRVLVAGSRAGIVSLSHGRH